MNSEEYEWQELDSSARTERIHREAVRQHVLERVRATSVGQSPFHHAYVTDVFPAEFYAALRLDMLRHKFTDATTDRPQDNPLYTNKRHSLFTNKGPIEEVLRYVFENDELKEAITSKFFVAPSRIMREALSIHVEFEYVYTEGGRYQNIHVDIPPKYVSFVFYLPEERLTDELAALNSTILYDKTLQPHYMARYQPNSLCLFAPHFHSYHGFSTTIPRDALVMFYISNAELDDYNAFHRSGADAPPFSGFRDRVISRLERHPLIEFGAEPARLREEYETCRINAPQGRVIVPAPARR